MPGVGPPRQSERLVFMLLEFCGRGVCLLSMCDRDAGGGYFGALERLSATLDSRVQQCRVLTP